MKLDFSHIASEPGARGDGNASPTGPQPPNGAGNGRQMEPRRVLAEVIRQLHRHFQSRPPSRSNSSIHASLAREVEEALQGPRMRLFMYLLYRRISALLRSSSSRTGVHQLWGALRGSPLGQGTRLVSTWLPAGPDQLLPIEVPQRRRRIQGAFDQRLSQALEMAVFKTIHPEYREKVSDRSSREEEIERTVKTVSGLNSGLFLGAAALMGTGIGLDIAFTERLPEAWQTMDRWFQLGGAGSAGLGVTTTTLLRRQRRQVSRGVEAIYWEDSSSASLERDLEDILELLETPEAPMEYRFVVVVDELDKAGSLDFLNDLIIRFKNFFTLSRASFIFISDETYYKYLLERQEEAASEDSYSLHHTFFTQKLFLPRPDFQDIRGYLDSINSQVARGALQPAVQEDWDHVVNYLTFASRSHFFDLVAHLNRLVSVTDDGEGLLLGFSPHQVRRLRFRQMANFQRTVSIIYDQEKYPSAEFDHRNDQLIARLYRVFDSFDRNSQESFSRDEVLPDPTEFPGELGERMRRAVERLLELLVAVDALEALQDPVQPSQYRWQRFLSKEPSITMLAPHPEQEEQLQAVRKLEQAIQEYQEVMV